MNHPRRSTRILAVVLIALAWATLATAIELRYEPPQQTIDIDTAGQLAIWLDSPLDIRTIEVTVAFNPAVLSELGGSPGAAFANLPCFVFEDYVPEDGQWYGFAVAIGSDCFVTGPGELWVWDFLGSGVGISAISTVSVVLADRFGQVLEDVTLPNASVTVTDGVTAVDEVPGPVPGRIQAYPNPCNPSTNVEFSLPGDRRGQLAVYDVEGRRVRTLLDGFLGGGRTSLRWDGRTDSGGAAPSGVYLFRLITDHEALAGRVTLTR